jgi:hypothetical protein
MRKTKEFQIFGIDYKTTQFSAMQSLDIIKKPNNLDPIQLLSLTSVKIENDFILLSGKNEINSYVVDKINHLPGAIVLRGLIKYISDYSFSFISDFKMIKTPAKFASDAKHVFSPHIEPMIAQLIHNGYGTLEKFEQYYSLEDAYILFDALVAQGVSEAYSADYAIKHPQK